MDFFTPFTNLCPSVQREPTTTYVSSHKITTAFTWSGKHDIKSKSRDFVIGKHLLALVTKVSLVRNRGRFSLSKRLGT